MHTPWKPARLMLAITAALSLILAGCGDDDDADETSDTTTAAGAAEVEVTLVDYAFQGLPAEVDAGTQFTVRNESQAELHEFVAFLLPAEETRPVTELAQLPPEEVQPIVGEPVTVVLARPGDDEDIQAVGDGTPSEPGRYAVMCFIPTGIDPDAYLQAAEQSQGGPPQVEGGGPPHFTRGMLAEVTVA